MDPNLWTAIILVTLFGGMGLCVVAGMLYLLFARPGHDPALASNHSRDDCGRCPIHP